MSKVGVIGAGISGLAAARRLVELGHQISVFDKGRSPGGRASTRRHDPFSFDHGAQYFTARNAAFVEFVEQCSHDGTLSPWLGRIASIKVGAQKILQNSEVRWVAAPQMNSLGKIMSDGLNLSISERIVELRKEGAFWHIENEEGQTWGPFDCLLITAPPEQAADLIGEHSPISSVLRSLAMQPCWATLCGFESAIPLDFDAAFCQESKLTWVCRNNSKPGRSKNESWVLHANREWSEANQDLPKNDVVSLMVQEFSKLLPVELPRLLHTDAHFWKYAQPVDDEAQGNVQDKQAGLFLAGDVFQGGRIEGAWLSGVEAAESIHENS